jgi:Cu/Ag efflux protein CusF
MKKLVTALTAAAFAVSIGTALAGEQTQGKIKAVDPASKQLLLDNGTMFTVSDAVMIKNLKPGQEVSVSYETKNGKNMADKVEVTK